MRRLIAGELRKLATTRLWLWLLLAALALTATYAMLDIAFADAKDTFTLPLSTPAGQRTLLAVGGGGAPLVAVLGVIGLTGEFRHRTATTTFLDTPRRVQIVVAKLIAYALVGAGYAVACSALTAAIAVPWLAARGDDLVVRGADLAGTYTGVVAALAVFALIGVGLGALLREQVVTVAGLLIYLLLLERVLTSVNSFDGWTRFLPGQASEALVGSTLVDQRLLAPWQGGIVLAGYAVVAAAAGTLALRRRDVL